MSPIDGALAYGIRWRGSCVEKTVLPMEDIMKGDQKTNQSYDHGDFGLEALFQWEAQNDLTGFLVARKRLLNRFKTYQKSFYFTVILKVINILKGCTYALCGTATEINRDRSGYDLIRFMWRTRVRPNRLGHGPTLSDYPSTIAITTKPTPRDRSSHRSTFTIEWHFASIDPCLRWERKCSRKAEILHSTFPPSNGPLKRIAGYQSNGMSTIRRRKLTQSCEMKKEAYFGVSKMPTRCLKGFGFSKIRILIFLFSSELLEKLNNSNPNEVSETTRFGAQFTLIIVVDFTPVCSLVSSWVWPGARVLHVRR